MTNEVPASLSISRIQRSALTLFTLCLVALAALSNAIPVARADDTGTKENELPSSSMPSPTPLRRRVLQEAGGSVVPAGVAAIARTQDPYLREAGSIVDAVKRRLPYWSDELPSYLDLWGRPVSYASGYGQVGAVIIADNSTRCD